MRNGPRFGGGNSPGRSGDVPNPRREEIRVLLCRSSPWAVTGLLAYRKVSLVAENGKESPMRLRTFRLNSLYPDRHNRREFSMSLIRLYCFGESGTFLQGRRWRLQLSGLDWEPVWVDFFQRRDSRSHGLIVRDVNEMGRGARRMVDGRSDAHAIRGHPRLSWCEKTGASLPGDRCTAERREVLRWILWDNHKTLRPDRASDPFQLMNFHPARRNAPSRSIGYHAGPSARLRPSRSSTGMSRRNVTGSQ